MAYNVRNLQRKTCLLLISYFVFACSSHFLSQFCFIQYLIYLSLANISTITVLAVLSLALSSCLISVAVIFVLLDPSLYTHFYFPIPASLWWGCNGVKGTIYLPVTGSANPNHLSPAAGDYQEVGTGPRSCCLTTPQLRSCSSMPAPLEDHLVPCPGCDNLQRSHILQRRWTRIDTGQLFKCLYRLSSTLPKWKISSKNQKL